jgi:hypothetical protein
MKRRVSIVQLMNYRTEAGVRLGRVNTFAQGYYKMCMVLEKFVKEGLLECYMNRVLIDKPSADNWGADARPPPDDIVVSRDVLPPGLTPQLAAALAWAGFRNCKCLSRRQRDQLYVLCGIWTGAELDAVIHL